jgi:hypothetical protein
MKASPQSVNRRLRFQLQKNQMHDPIYDGEESYRDSWYRDEEYQEFESALTEEALRLRLKGGSPRTWLANLQGLLDSFHEPHSNRDVINLVEDTFHLFDEDCLGLEDLAHRAIATRRRCRRRWLWRQVQLLDEPINIARICRDVGRRDSLIAH